MDSSSEDDYLWEKCSSSESEAMAHEEESDFDKRYKKKLQKELFQNGELEDSQEEPRVRKKKKIKREPGSPAVKDEPDSPALLNGHTVDDTERVLELKVKEEQASFVVPRETPRKRQRSAGSGDDAPARKKKKAKKERRDEPDAEEPPKKKKKKYKQETDESDIVIDKFDAEEAVVEKRQSVTNRPKVTDKPFTSKEFVEDDSDSDEERRSQAPPAQRFDSVREKSRSPEPVPKRPLKIRERITYEEESQDRVSPSPSVSPGASPRRDDEAQPRVGRLARYLRAHKHLTAVPAQAADAAVSADDDVWLVRCPRDLDAAALAGAALTLDGRCKLKAGGRAYEAAPAPTGARAALVAGGARWRVRGVRVRGALRLRARVPRVRAPPAAPPEPHARVPLPATSTRHPLLGVDYERAPAPRPRPRPEPKDTPELDDSERREKKKKKKKEKRKREREEAPPPAADVWDSERAIEQSLFNF